MLLFNSLTCRKDLFTPLTPKKVLLYVCGITPYDTTHLGHAFTYISFDALVRYLRYKGFDVDYVQNVTDIDDDILKRAKQVEKDWRVLGTYWTNRFVADMEALNIIFPTHYVKATNSITEIIVMTKKLLEEKFAYERNGNVYFAVKKFKKYGELSRFSREQMLVISQERGGNIADPLKHDPLDFLLWQKSAKGEPFWESPWGKGRPGWHIECSAMVEQYLGNQIDIHGGGRDLIYPHHESEIAQSESYTGKSPYVRYWMHNAMLLYQGEKMSKSLGNLVMVRNLLKTYSPNTIRWVLLSHHYRTPWEYYETEADEAEKLFGRVRKAIKNTKLDKNAADERCLKKFETFMNDDLQTPKVLDLITSLVEKIEKKKYTDEQSVKTNLYFLLDVLGFVV